MLNFLLWQVESFICGQYSSLLSGYGAVARLVHILYALKYHILTGTFVYMLLKSKNSHWSKKDAMYINYVVTQKNL